MPKDKVIFLFSSFFCNRILSIEKLLSAACDHLQRIGDYFSGLLEKIHLGILKHQPNLFINIITCHRQK
jgi:hypothetical protein